MSDEEETRIEMDFRTRMTLTFPGDCSRGGASFAARINHLIVKAIQADGFAFAEGVFNPPCSTDVYRIEYIKGGDKN